MKLIVKGRCTGKTTQLVYASEVYGIPIVVATEQAKNHILWMAEQIGCDIPEPIVFRKGPVCEKLNKQRFKRGVLIDNAEFFITPALEEYFGVPVVAATVSYDLRNKGNL